MISASVLSAFEADAADLAHVLHAVHDRAEDRAGRRTAWALSVASPFGFA